jgi:uncharacterized protein YceH (UPF0502 family)
MHRFDELANVLAGLQKLTEREPPLAALLPRLPGTKEPRYAHLLSGPAESSALAAVEHAAGSAARDGRMAQLEADVAALRQEVAALRQKMDSLGRD